MQKEDDDSRSKEMAIGNMEVDADGAPGKFDIQRLYVLLALLVHRTPRCTGGGGRKQGCRISGADGCVQSILNADNRTAWGTLETLNEFANTLEGSSGILTESA